MLEKLVEYLAAMLDPRTADNTSQEAIIRKIFSK